MSEIAARAKLDEEKASSLEADLTALEQGIDLVFRGSAALSVGNTTGAMKRAIELQREFGLEQVVKSKEEQVIKSPMNVIVPLVWSVRLPTEKKKVTFKTYNGKVKAVIPFPPKEAMEAIQKYHKEFDWLEMWWVPTDMEFIEKPDPDPIIVGAVGNQHNVVYLELYRWIDETVEDPYFNAVAY